MSEENGLIYCSQCGSANPSTFKFCSNCGSKLEQPQGTPIVQPQASGPDKEPQPETPAYERADAEVVSEGKVPLTQDELNINYGAEEEGTFSSGDNGAQDTQYYSAETFSAGISSAGAGGNSGFAIASMICGIISILCCCLTWVSLILAIAAVVLGIIALRYQYDGKGMAVAGIVTGGIGIFIWLIYIIVIAAGAAGSGIFSSLTKEILNMFS